MHSHMGRTVINGGVVGVVAGVLFMIATYFSRDFVTDQKNVAKEFASYKEEQAKQHGQIAAHEAADEQKFLSFQGQFVGLREDIKNMRDDIRLIKEAVIRK